MFDVYEFGVQIWFEDGEWNWGIVQEFESDNSSEVEALAYGTEETAEAAASAAADALKTIQLV